MANAGTDCSDAYDAGFADGEGGGEGGGGGEF